MFYLVLNLYLYNYEQIYDLYFMFTKIHFVKSLNRLILILSLQIFNSV